MSTINAKGIVSAVCAAVSSGSGVTVTPEFPDRQQDLPLRAPIVSVGVKAILMEDEEGAKLTQTAAPTYVTVRLSVCVPKTMTGERSMQTVDSVVNSLTSLLQNHTVTKISVGDTRYSATISALVTDIEVKMYLGNGF